MSRKFVMILRVVVCAFYINTSLQARVDVAAPGRYGHVNQYFFTNLITICYHLIQFHVKMCNGRILWFLESIWVLLIQLTACRQFKLIKSTTCKDEKQVEVTRQTTRSTRNTRVLKISRGRIVKIVKVQIINLLQWTLFFIGKMM